MEKIKNERVAVLFTNISKTDFHHTWDKVTYKFKAGKSQYLEFPLAYHFAKHLAWRELGQEKYMEKSPEFQAFIHKCISTEDEIEAEDDTQLRQEMLNKSKGTSEGLTPPKKKSDEDEFEGFKNETTKSKRSK